MKKLIALRLLSCLAVCPGVKAQCELQKLTASSSETNAFGSRVALSDTFTVMGTPDESSVEYGAGMAYVFQATPSGWVELTQLFGDDIGFDGGDEFGDSVAISGDTIMIGAPGDISDGDGAVFVYEYDGVAWIQTAKLTISVTGFGFGDSVALEGDRALIGATAGISGPGAAHIFERSGSVWIETSVLTPGNGAPGDDFGSSVALSGNLALVGARGENGDSGAAYVFDGGMAWARVARIVPSDPDFNQRFGSAVSIDGPTAVIGAWGDDEMAPGAGAAYVFEEGISTWSQVTKLLAADGEQGEALGWSVAIEGQTIVIGSVADHPGSAYVFREVQEEWEYEVKLAAGDGLPFNNFGSGVAVAGNTVLVGAQLASGPFGNLGAAYVFQAPTFVRSYCFGIGCPCGNDDPVLGGCANSVPGYDQNPQGALLAACGSASVAADDLTLTLSHLPSNKFGLFFMGGGQTQIPFGDGLRCVDTGGVGLFRYNPPQNSGGAGFMTLGPGIVARSMSFAMSGHIDAGETWYFQGWYRDPMGPCGAAFNLSNGLAVTFGP